MKQLILIVISLFWMTAYQVKGQEFVGIHADTLKLMMKVEYRDFSLNTSSTNRYYRYLKYEDRIGTQTFLIFLDEKNICKYYKEIYDFSLQKQVFEDLNNRFVNIGDTLWTEKVENGIVMKKLTQNEWFFSITTRLEKK